ncbi:MAG: N-acetyl-gamma-glutamyl-phosphate reductase [Phycisphaerales bacterium]
MRDPIRIAIVGAPGYTGAELASILASHPAAELVGLFGSDRRAATDATAETMADLFPRLAGVVDLPVRAGDAASILACAPDAVFLATPHEASERLAPALLEAGVVVFDLSAAFRLRDASLYPRHYGFEHAHAPLLGEAVYGLPELAGDALRAAQLIACPGCYPTSVILPVRPLVAAGIIDRARPVIVDSASGVSGAGRSAAVKSLFCEVSLQPYGVLSHRHQPEMAQETGARILFTPHLVALDRGILSTIHAELAPGRTLADARACLERTYADAPFVRLLPAGRWPSIAAVERTNCCDIALGTDETGSHLVVSSAIDNLTKGAAGQAVQAFNVRFGLEETTALGIARRVAAGAAS